MMKMKKLKSMEDLKKIKFGQSVPAHSLLLLHWFANTLIIDDNNRMRLTFDPSNGDYGSHHYGNYERVFGPPPQGHQYYTVGNLYKSTLRKLPDHVVNPPVFIDKRNKDRIIFRVFGKRTDQVFITQHYDNSDYHGTAYDPHHTFQISPNLLRQIQEFSLSANYNTLLDLGNRYGANIVPSERNVWGHLAFLGLFWCIVMDKPFHIQEQSRRPERRGSDEIHLIIEPDSDSCPCTPFRWLCCVLLLIVFIVVIALIYFYF